MPAGWWSLLLVSTTTGACFHQACLITSACVPIDWVLCVSLVADVEKRILPFTGFVLVMYRSCGIEVHGDLGLRNDCELFGSTGVEGRMGLGYLG